MDWDIRAEALARSIAHTRSRWYEPIAGTPRHELVPRWWEYAPDEGGWTLRVGEDDTERWMNAAYSNKTLVTRVGPLHADRAEPGDHPEGKPTSSSTLPALVVDMYRHAMIDSSDRVLCVTGTGYGTALLTHRLGYAQVTSVDVDPHLVATARERLAAMGLYATVEVCDITGVIPERHDRIVSTVGLPGIPSTWLNALNPGGRLVTNIAGTAMVIVADKTADGGARGQVAADRAAFMGVRHAADYPPAPDDRYAWTDEGATVTTGRYPVVHVPDCWDIVSAFALAAPGVRHSYEGTDDGRVTAVMVHDDGSWARATGHHGQPPTVHQAGPRRLWDILDDLRHHWLSNGALPPHGARVRIDRDGTLHLKRGTWTAVIPPAPAPAPAVAATP